MLVHLAVSAVMSLMFMGFTAFFTLVMHRSFFFLEHHQPSLLWEQTHNKPDPKKKNQNYVYLRLLMTITLPACVCVWQRESDGGGGWTIGACHCTWLIPPHPHRDGSTRASLVHTDSKPEIVFLFTALMHDYEDRCMCAGIHLDTVS